MQKSPGRQLYDSKLKQQQDCPVCVTVTKFDQMEIHGLMCLYLVACEMKTIKNPCTVQKLGDHLRAPLFEYLIIQASFQQKHENMT